jgi:hypothetical protein
MANLKFHSGNKQIETQYHLTHQNIYKQSIFNLNIFQDLKQYGMFGDAWVKTDYDFSLKIFDCCTFACGI